MSERSYPFPYFWYGAWSVSLALKTQTTYVWFADEPDPEQRGKIASGAPKPMKGATWYGALLVLMSFGTIEYDITRDYGKPRKSAVTAFTDAKLATLLRNATRALHEAGALTTLSSNCVSRLIPALEGGAQAIPLLASELRGYIGLKRAGCKGGK
jgi:hypothetical protein